MRMKVHEILRGTLPALAVFGALLALLLYPELASGAVAASLRVCGTMLLPSLFPFFVCTELLISLDLATIPARLLGGAMPRLFHVRPRGAAALVLGLTGGYPMGAQAAAQLYAQGALSREECERLVPFCNNAGPAFILGVMGATVFHSARCGLALYIIHIISAVLCGLLFRAPALPAAVQRASAQEAPHAPFSALFTRSVRQAVQSALGLCGFVVVFGVLSRFLLALLPSWLPEGVRVLLCGLLELGNGASLLAQAALPFPLRFALAAFLLGFGGVSVWAQTASILIPSGLRIDGYLTVRLLHGALSAVLALAAQQLFPLADPALPAMATPMQTGAAVLAPALFYTAATIFIIFRNLMGGNPQAKGV